jgi:hypothetical protein
LWASCAEAPPFNLVQNGFDAMAGGGTAAHSHHGG